MHLKFWNLIKMIESAAEVQRSPLKSIYYWSVLQSIQNEFNCIMFFMSNLTWFLINQQNQLQVSVHFSILIFSADFISCSYFLFCFLSFPHLNFHFSFETLFWFIFCLCFCQHCNFIPLSGFVFLFSAVSILMPIMYRILSGRKIKWEKHENAERGAEFILQGRHQENKERVKSDGKTRERERGQSGKSFL